MNENKSVYPFNGYAPGNYMNDCAICKKRMSNVDKLCFVCLECAIRASSTRQESSTPVRGVDEKPAEYYNQLTKDLGKTREYHFNGQRCVAGCKRFTGYEVYHHKDCPFYKNSFSERYDKLLAAPPVNKEGLEWVLITKGMRLPDDFALESIINREKYIVEVGFKEGNEWFDEIKATATLEQVGVFVLGGSSERQIRYRQRNSNDNVFDVSKTIIGRISNISL